MDTGEDWLGSMDSPEVGRDQQKEKALELARAASDEVNRGIRRELKSMNNKLNRLLGLPQDVEGDD